MSSVKLRISSQVERLNSSSLGTLNPTLGRAAWEIGGILAICGCSDPNSSLGSSTHWVSPLPSGHDNITPPATATDRVCSWNPTGLSCTKHLETYYKSHMAKHACHIASVKTLTNSSENLNLSLLKTQKLLCVLPRGNKKRIVIIFCSFSHLKGAIFSKTQWIVESSRSQKMC